ncbi:MAG: efflux RND transporter periplasmic adaptor subunit [Desulfovibrio sp.]|nr:MAG: efflux RND transporter periplasmic adaptor subunit [Desulfovibrio sp.]
MQRLRAVLLMCLVLAVVTATPASAQDTAGADLGTPLSVVFTPRYEAIVASEVTATILEVNKEFGQAFTQGDVLVLLDDSRFRLARNRAGAQVAAASKTYSVNQELFENDSASVLEVEQARGALGVAQAEYAQADRDIESCTIVAPFTGRVSKLMVNAHETVQEGQELLEIVDDSVLLVKTLLPSAAFRSVSVGLEVMIQVNEIDAQVSGAVSHISATLDPASGTFEIYAEVDNSEGQLRSGMTGTLILDLP